jgi:ribosomal subunit interface protein
MSIAVTGKNIEVGDSLREFVTQELHKVVEHYMGDIIEAQVVFSKSHHLFSVDVTVHISSHLIVHCFSHGDDDAYRSATNAIHKLESRIKKYKTKLRNRRRFAKEDTLEPLPAQQYILNPQEEDTGDDAPIVIAEMDSQIHSLSVGEAVMKLDLKDVPVVLFRNAASGQFNVVYKRQDGNIGWIDPSLKVD